MRSSVRSRAVSTSTGVRSPRARAWRSAVRPLREAAGRAGRGRQAEVEQHRVEGLHAPQVVGVLDVRRHVDAVARIAQAAQHHVAQHRIVFDQEDSHGIGRREFVTGGLPRAAGEDTARRERPCTGH